MICLKPGLKPGHEDSGEGGWCERADSGQRDGGNDWGDQEIEVVDLPCENQLCQLNQLPHSCQDGT